MAVSFIGSTLMLNRSQINVLLLALCQALAATSITLLFTVGTLVGYSLATDKSLATLPVTLLQLATMLATIPASLIMKHTGRQKGFIIGSGIGMVGAGLSVQSIVLDSFWLFCLGTFCIGSFSSFSWYYRFAAADASTEAFRPKAISLVMSGGVIAALLGPSIATWAKDWFSAYEFAGSIAMIIALQLAAIALLFNIHIPPAADTNQTSTGRPLSAIARQPVFIVAVLGSMVGYGVMSLVMTSTPLAMQGFEYPFPSIASVIRWHVLGMFAPSFITGILITRFGLLNIIFAGALLNILCSAIALTGTGFPYFAIALLFLGVGWNFMFIGSTTLLTHAYEPAEKAKAQATHDFFTFGFVAFCSLMSGQLLYHLSWNWINGMAIGAVAIAMVANVWLRYSQNKQVAVSK
jgi:predicted MFS family arabinose efflux permease